MMQGMGSCRAGEGDGIHAQSKTGFSMATWSFSFRIIHPVLWETWKGGEMNA